MRQILLSKQAIIAFTLCAVGTLLAAAGDDGLKAPNGFKDWYFANSMLLTTDQNKFGLNAGNHLIYINAKGLERFKRGDASPYPDGTVFVDDVRSYTTDGGAYLDAGRKFLTTMVKDSKKYASTGGWGFQAWVGGDPSKPVVMDAAKQCFACHTSQKAHDFAFSTYVD